jgi:mannose-6-phosphate isomerase-like protein (cupin superfamily)
MGFASLFTGAGEGARVELPALGIVMRVLVPAAGAGGQLAMIEETTGPGRGPPLHVHHRQTETFLFLEGEYEILVGDRRFRAAPGVSAVVPPGVPHAFRNVGAALGRLAFILSPALEGEAFFAALAAATEAGMPDQAALDELGRRFGTEIVGAPLGAG